MWRWERNLSIFAQGLPSQNPPRRVWASIRRRTQPSSAATSKFFDWARGFWLAIPAAAAAAWLAIALSPTTSFERVAVVSDEGAETVWVISADLDRGLLETRVVSTPELAAGSDFELWILAADGPPLSLGVLSVEAGSIESQIPTQLIAALTSAGRLAVSLEPAGGSPTGLPTGPIVYVAPLLTI